MSSADPTRSYPFKHVLSKSKSFLSNLTTGKDKGKDSDDDTTAGRFHYKRRMRVVTDTERRTNPLNLGENGWGERSWERIKREQRQKEELEELLEELGGSAIGNGAISSVKAVPAEPRASVGQERRGRIGQERVLREGENRRVSGSAETYNRPLPLRASGPRDPPSPQSYRTRGPGNPTTTTTGPTSTGQHASQIRDSRTSAYSTSSRPLRTRVAGPRPAATHKRTGSYTSQGVRVTPGSFHDREREEYRARLGQQDSPRAADGTRKNIGGTLF